MNVFIFIYFLGLAVGTSAVIVGHEILAKEMKNQNLKPFEAVLLVGLFTLFWPVTVLFSIFLSDE